ncbi:MAG: rod shape-determining protein MreB [Rhodobacterales bacterium]|nr:rod shape-determining protein MreB [Rhodobacterales bacterium]
MFSTVLGLFSQDLAVDPGTANTRVWLRGRGLVAEEPTVVAVQNGRQGRREVTAIGAKAREMLGRAPQRVEVVEPIQSGRIRNYEVAEAFLLHLFRTIHGRNRMMRPRMVIPVPVSASQMEIRALRDSCQSAGARDVIRVARPIAAALGAGISVCAPQGQMVVDLGAGSTEIAVISHGKVTAFREVPGGGRAMDNAIIDMLRVDHELLIGRQLAEQIKAELGSAGTAKADVRIAKGRCLRRGIPRAAKVRADEVCRAISPGVDAVVLAVRDLLSSLPPGQASDILTRGIVLTGGCSQLHEFDRVLSRRTGLPVMMTPEPSLAVVRGAGRVLEEHALQQVVGC